MAKKYLFVNGSKVEVSEDVYKAYYQSYEKEKYQNKKKKDKEVSYNKFIEDGFPVESKLINKGESAEDQAMTNLLYEIINHAINNLSDRERHVIVLIVYENKSDNDVAVLMGVSRQYVNKLKIKALSKLKKEISKKFLNIGC